jgi:hypothetical protein
MMKTKHLLLPGGLVLLLALLAVGGSALHLASPAAAQTSASYNLEWHVVGGGGGPITSASYAVNSTTGQKAASPPYSASSHYTVSGGYWFSGSLAPIWQVYLPLVFRNHH